MPLGDATYQAAALDAVIASWPTTATYRLFTGDPTLGGVELAATGGYAPATFSPSDWTTSGVSSTATISFGTSTAAYADTATYWALVDTSGAIVYYDDLTPEVDIPDFGYDVTISPSLFFDRV